MSVDKTNIIQCKPTENNNKNIYINTNKTYQYEQ